MDYPVPGAISLPGLANIRYAALSGYEVQKYGHRTIGGDKGDVRFEGYTLDRDNNATVLYKPVLVNAIDGLTEDEVNELAREIVQFSFDSIGLETVEHN